MTHKEIKESIALLQRLDRQREDILWENEGEETEEVISLDEQMNAIEHLLNTEGVDELGRWMVSVQAKADNYDTEIKKLQRLKNNCKSTQDYIKSLMGQMLRHKLDDDGNPINEIKGMLYKFKASTSVSNTIDREMLNEDYLDKASKAVRKILPEGVGIELKLTTTAAKQSEELNKYLVTTTEETSTFIKPRKQ